MAEYECSTCGASFESPDELKEHIEDDHSGEGDVSEFTCSQCQESFSTKDELVEHINSAHPEE